MSVKSLGIVSFRSFHYPMPPKTYTKAGLKGESVSDLKKKAKTLGILSKVKVGSKGEPLKPDLVDAIYKYYEKKGQTGSSGKKASAKKTTPKKDESDSDDSSKKKSKKKDSEKKKAPAKKVKVTKKGSSSKKDSSSKIEHPFTKTSGNKAIPMDEQDEAALKRIGKTRLQEFLDYLKVKYDEKDTKEKLVKLIMKNRSKKSSKSKSKSDESDDDAPESDFDVDDDGSGSEKEEEEKKKKKKPTKAKNEDNSEDEGDDEPATKDESDGEVDSDLDKSDDDEDTIETLKARFAKKTKDILSSALGKDKAAADFIQMFGRLLNALPSDFKIDDFKNINNLSDLCEKVEKKKPQDVKVVSKEKKKKLEDDAKKKDEKAKDELKKAKKMEDESKKLAKQLKELEDKKSAIEKAERELKKNKEDADKKEAKAKIDENIKKHAKKKEDVKKEITKVETKIEEKKDDIVIEEIKVQEAISDAADSKRTSDTAVVLTDSKYECGDGEAFDLDEDKCMSIDSKKQTKNFQTSGGKTLKFQFKDEEKINQIKNKIGLISGVNRYLSDNRHFEHLQDSIYECLGQSKSSLDLNA